MSEDFDDPRSPEDMRADAHPEEAQASIEAAEEMERNAMEAAMRQAPKESNWEMCLRMAREIDKDELIRALLVKIGQMRKKNERGVPLWSFVGDATSHGCGVSTAICAVYGVNSNTGIETEAKA